jgi:hypothetical protein
MFNVCRSGCDEPFNEKLCKGVSGRLILEHSIDETAFLEVAIAFAIRACRKNAKRDMAELERRTMHDHSVVLR